MHFQKCSSISYWKLGLPSNGQSLLSCFSMFCCFFFLLSSLPLKWDFGCWIHGLLINMLVMLPCDFKVRGLPRCAIWLQLGGEHTFSCWPLIVYVYYSMWNLKWKDMCLPMCVLIAPMSSGPWLVWLVVKHGTRLLLNFDPLFKEVDINYKSIDLS
jgi:hypothetical protein